MTDPNLPHDPRFSPPQAPQAPQPPQAPQAPQPPQAPQVPQAPQAPQPPPFSQQPPVAPPGYHPPASPPIAGTSPPSIEPQQPQFFQTDGATVEDRVDTKRSVAGRVGLVAAALAVVGGGAFAVNRALSEPAGPQSPEEAISQLFEAVDNDDLIGLTEVMLPSEREALIDPTIDLVAELGRLEIVDEDVDLQARSDEPGTDGLDFSVTGLEFTTVPVGEGVVNIELDAGVVTVSGEVADLPFGDRAIDELGEENMSEAIDEEIINFRDEENSRLTVVEEDGSWYVSLWYSVAEAARADTDEPAPSFGAGVEPVGGSTPEDALRVMIEAAVDLDAEGVIAAMDPSEFRALYDYAPLFLDDVDEAEADFRQMLDDEGVSWSLERLDLSSSEIRGRTVVSIDGFAFSANAEGEQFSFDFDGDCATVIQNSTIDEACISELRDELADGDELPEAYLDLIENQNSGVTVVERDGSWYVSGFPTIIGAYTDLLASLEPEDIDQFQEFFSSSFEDAFDVGDPVFEEILGSDDPVLEQFPPIEEDPFFEDEDDYDPFADEEPTFATFEVSPEDAALFTPDWTLEGDDPRSAYFAGSIGLPATSFFYAYAPDGLEIIYVERFEESADLLNQGMATNSFYTQVDVPGLPEGATAYDWEGIDRAIVIDGFVVSAYFGEDDRAMELLNQQVELMLSRN